MTFSEFQESLNHNHPPNKLSKLLLALWWDAKGDWKKAHKVTQDISSTDAAWVHAYLHRKEGDEWNANYWYSRAEKSKSVKSLPQEWEEIVNSFLKY